MDSKSPFLSKTLWTNLAIAALAFFPAMSGFMANNPQWVMTGFALINMGLRLVTKKPLAIE